VSGFHEVSLPLALAFGASGGPMRRTEITMLASGQEVRNTPWAGSRRRYDLGGALRSLDDLHALIAFFEARRGQLHGFRFRDPADWRSRLPGQAPQPTDQALGAGDGTRTAFQLTKTYEPGPHAEVRVIHKPVAGSVRVAVAGVELAAGAFAVDAATGVVTLAAPPAPGAAVSAGFAFDTPVRFDADRLDISFDAFSAGRAVSVALIEILL